MYKLRSVRKNVDTCNVRTRSVHRSSLIRLRFGVENDVIFKSGREIDVADAKLWFSFQRFNEILSISVALKVDFHFRHLAQRLSQLKSPPKFLWSCKHQFPRVLTKEWMRNSRQSKFATTLIMRRLHRAFGTAKQKKRN